MELRMALSQYDAVERLLRQEVSRRIDAEVSPPHHIWTGPFKDGGKGRRNPCFGLMGDNYQARRLIWRWAHGTLDTRWNVFVTCDRDDCVLIEHLEIRPGQQRRRRPRTLNDYLAEGA